MSNSIIRDVLRDDNFSYFLRVRKRLQNNGIKETSKEIKLYYNKYVDCVNSIGEIPDFKYKLFVFYNYFKIVSIHPHIKRKELLNYFPTRFQKYFIYELDPKEKRTITFDKLLFYKELSKVNLPYPTVYFYKANNQLFDISDHSLDSLNIKKLPENFFVKPIRENGGVGAGIMDLEDIDKIPNDTLIQDIAINHPKIIEIGGNFAFNTVRLITYIDLNNRVNILSAILRLSKGPSVDNWGRGSVNVNINIEDGKLGNIGLTKKGEVYKKHPAGQEFFEDFEVPYWDELLTTIDEAALHFSYLKFIAWDIGIGPDGPVIVEANAGCDFFHAQLFRPYGDTVLMRDVLELKKNKSQNRCHYNE